VIKPKFKLRHNRGEFRLGGNRKPRRKDGVLIVNGGQSSTKWQFETDH